MEYNIIVLIAYLLLHVVMETSGQGHFGGLINSTAILNNIMMT